jgi:hypothetical protein
MTEDDNVNKINHFIEQVRDSINKGQLTKLLLSKYRGEELELQRIVVRPIILREQQALSFVYSYKTRDITKNLSLEDALKIIEPFITKDFKSIHLYTHEEQTQIDISKKGKVLLHKHKFEQSQADNTQQTHNRAKNRFVDIDRPYLTALGVTDAQQQLIPAMSRKWKQINKFIEICSQAIEQSSLAKKETIDVVDFGSGKGYLTFAIHDYLQHNINKQTQVSGVELRESLVALCNKTAKQLSHNGLDFVCGDVKTHAPKQTDIMIALHACDVATDYAIHYGIQANASIIMCSPCCHKEIRPQIKIPEVLNPLLKYGTHLGQEAEMATDTLRALLLEANGYSTKVFEFVSLEHTNKNKMILAVKRNKHTDNSKTLEQIAALKSFYGIEHHCLETLLASN